MAENNNSVWGGRESYEGLCSRFDEILNVTYKNGASHVYGVEGEGGRKVHLSHEAVLANYGYGKDYVNSVIEEDALSSDEVSLITPDYTVAQIEENGGDDERRNDFWSSRTQAEIEFPQPPQHENVFARIRDRVRLAHANLITNHTRRRNIIIGAVAGAAAGLLVWKITGDHDTTSHLMNGSDIGPHNTLAAHDGQTLSETLRLNGYDHPSSVISNLNDTGALDHGKNTGELARNLAHGSSGDLVIENSSRGLDNRIFLSQDFEQALASNSATSVATESQSVADPIIAAGIGSVTSGVGAFLLTRERRIILSEETEERSDLDSNQGAPNEIEIAPEFEIVEVDGNAPDLVVPEFESADSVDNEEQISQLHARIDQLVSTINMYQTQVAAMYSLLDESQRQHYEEYLTRLRNEQTDSLGDDDDDDGLVTY